MSCSYWQLFVGGVLAAGFLNYVVSGTARVEKAQEELGIWPGAGLAAVHATFSGLLLCFDYWVFVWATT